MSKQLVWTGTPSGESAILKVKELRRRLETSQQIATALGFGEQPLLDMIEEARAYMEDAED